MKLAFTTGLFITFLFALSATTTTAILRGVTLFAGDTPVEQQEAGAAIVRGVEDSTDAVRRRLQTSRRKRSGRSGAGQGRDWVRPRTGPLIDTNDGGCDCIVHKDGTWNCTGARCGDRGGGGGRRLPGSSRRGSNKGRVGDGPFPWDPNGDGPEINLADGGCDCIMGKDGIVTCTGCGNATTP
jgi:hypothetical protein